MSSLDLGDGAEAGLSRPAMESFGSDSSFYDLLSRFRVEATSLADMGDRFERLIVQYLRSDPQYSQDIDYVKQWGEWEYRSGHDVGIDIVVKTKSGDYWAVQCKFYDISHTISKSDVDTFISASGRRFSTHDGECHFIRRLFFTTTERWSPHAYSALSSQDVPVSVIGSRELSESPVGWSDFDISGSSRLQRRLTNSVREHQRDAIAAAVMHYREHERGQMIMACGTGKTFTALRLMEALVASEGLVLFLVPSISLVSQAMREWTAQAEDELYVFAVCSDVRVGKGSANNEDMSVSELLIPATTEADKLASGVKGVEGGRRKVIFSTYHSIDVIIEAQREQGLGDIDLVICDEAHRTAGLNMPRQKKPKKGGEEEDAQAALSTEKAGVSADSGEVKDSHFTRVHYKEHLRAARRLYMTATPRIYAEKSKTQAKAREDTVLYSMDDTSLFGEVFYNLPFKEAVEADLLSDYKVIIVATEEERMTRLASQYNERVAELAVKDAHRLTDKKDLIDTDFAAKLIGTWKGLSRSDEVQIATDGTQTRRDDDAPALSILHRGVVFTRTIAASKQINKVFEQIQALYVEGRGAQAAPLATVSTRHIDGGMNAIERHQQLRWLREEVAADNCHLLSNARCLSEGVDVPSLDAVAFFDERESVVDVVQAVGRVMRRAPGKKYGYIILPVCIPSGEIDNFDNFISNDKQFTRIWKVLKALRAHDERFVSEAFFKERVKIVKEPTKTDTPATQGDLEFPIPWAEFSKAIYTAIPNKLGDKEYWTHWAKDISRTARLVANELRKIFFAADNRRLFDEFLDGLHNELNPAVSEDEAVEMLAQHLITKPVFEALFEGYSFIEHNPVSQSLQRVIDAIDTTHIDAEMAKLDGFFRGIEARVKLATDNKAKQDLIRNLYDTFFKEGFPQMAERLGIAYTPIELVDFVLTSANHALKQEFDRSLSDNNVHILDPFTGTGSFITRLIQNPDLIKQADLEHKFKNEIHTNEVLLLAYYIASVNIEAAYHARQQQTDAFTPFNGAVLTDTFQLYEGKGRGNRALIEGVFSPDNSARAKKQINAPIRVIVGNPPWSAKQKNENDANKNLIYPILDDNIRNSYATHSKAVNKSALYDSYIRAIRWASDQIEENGGVIAFITNGGWLDSNSADGLRYALAQEFDVIWFIDLRGNLRSFDKKEGESAFEGIMTKVGIVILIKNPENPREIAAIHYHDIGDYLKRPEKIAKLVEAKSIAGLEFQPIKPNPENDWINQRDPRFDTFIELGNKEAKARKKSGGVTVFRVYSRGVETTRDAWVYNFSQSALTNNIKRTIKFFNQQSHEFKTALEADEKLKPDDVISNDSTKISWSRGLKDNLLKGKSATFEKGNIRPSLYRPFTREYLYFDTQFTNLRGRHPVFFPTPESKNSVIVVSGIGAKNFSALVSNCASELHFQSNGQCFPRYIYGEDGERHDNITSEAVSAFNAHYERDDIDADAIFYYVYGVLHASDYRAAFAFNLKKQLPRLPFAPDFDAFAKAGRVLADLHLNYETGAEHPLALTKPDGTLIMDDMVLDDEHYRVKKMKWRDSACKTRIIYNDHIVLDGIPAEATQYVVNGRSPLDWIMARYCLKQDKASGIINDPNDWRPDDSRYIIRLIARLVHMSIATTRILQTLPNSLTE